MNIERNQITIGLSVENYWLSIVECKADGYHVKELALVRKNAKDFFGISMVRLEDWYDRSCYSDEVTVNLLLGRETDAVVLHKCLSRAEEYLSIFRGLEFMVGDVEQENN